MEIKVSFIVVALNAASTIQTLFECLRRQTYPHEWIEVILIDGLSSDATKAEMLRFQAEANDFWQIKVLDNPKKTLPCGWNVALGAAQGDALLRVDAHVSIPDNFIELNVRDLLQGENICGGKVTSVPADDSRWSLVLNEAENSMFGGGFAAFRRAKSEGYVSTAAFAIYRKEVFDTVGQYNETLARTEDNEMHYRMRKAGYRFYYDPEIVSYRKTRADLKGLIKQKYYNGYWIGRTLWIEPRCFSLYHFVPLGFVLAIAVCSALTILGINWPARLLWYAYAAANLLMTVASVIGCKKRNWMFLFLPFIYLSLHVSYGIGTLIGIVAGKKCKH